MSVNKSLKINAILNGLKQLCAVVFPLISFPYVSRVLGNDSFGKYSFSNSIIGYFSLFAGFGVYSYAVREGAKLRDNTESFKHFVNEVYSINVLSTLISFTCLLVILLNDSMSNYRVISLILSLNFIFSMVGTDWINTIFEDFLYITIRYILFQLFSLIFLFVFVHSPDDVYWYAIDTVIANSAGNIANILYIRKYVRKRIIRRLNIKKHIKPLLVLFINSLALTIYVNSDITMVGIYYSDSQVGIYTLSSKIYNIAKNLINAIVLVSVPRLSNVFSDNSKFDNYTSKIFSTLITITLPFSIGLFALSKHVIALIGGEQYADGNISLKILCIAIVFAILGSFFTNCYLIVSRNEKYILIATSVSSVINVLLNLFFIPRFGINGAAFTTVLAEMVAFLIECFYAVRKCRKVVLNYRDLFSSLAGVAMMVIVLSLFNSLIVINNEAIFIIISVLCSAISYYLVLLMFGNTFAKSIVTKC